MTEQRNAVPVVEDIARLDRGRDKAMYALQKVFFLTALVMSVTLGASAFAQSTQSRSRDTCESNPLAGQTSKLSDREMTARAEDRAESLRVRLFELTVKELDLLARLDDLDYRSSPEGIQRALAFVGSARPIDELREALRIRLERERARLNTQIELLASIREKLETAIRDVDSELSAARQH